MEFCGSSRRYQPDEDQFVKLGKETSSTTNNNTKRKNHRRVFPSTDSIEELSMINSNNMNAPSTPDGPYSLNRTITASPRLLNPLTQEDWSTIRENNNNNNNSRIPSSFITSSAATNTTTTLDCTRKLISGIELIQKIFTIDPNTPSRATTNNRKIYHQYHHIKSKKLVTLQFDPIKCDLLVRDKNGGNSTIVIPLSTIQSINDCGNKYFVIKLHNNNNKDDREEEQHKQFYFELISKQQLQQQQNALLLSSSSSSSSLSWMNDTGSFVETFRKFLDRNRPTDTILKHLIRNHSNIKDKRILGAGSDVNDDIVSSSNDTTNTATTYDGKMILTSLKEQEKSGTLHSKFLPMKYAYSHDEDDDEDILLAGRDLLAAVSTRSTFTGYTGFVPGAPTPLGRSSSSVFGDESVLQSPPRITSTKGLSRKKKSSHVVSSGSSRTNNVRVFETDDSTNHFFSSSHGGNHDDVTNNVIIKSLSNPSNQGMELAWISSDDYIGTSSSSGQNTIIHEKIKNNGRDINIPTLDDDEEDDDDDRYTYNRNHHNIENDCNATNNNDSHATHRIHVYNRGNAPPTTSDNYEDDEVMRRRIMIRSRVRASSFSDKTPKGEQEVIYSDTVEANNNDTSNRSNLHVVRSSDGGDASPMVHHARSVDPWCEADVCGMSLNEVSQAFADLFGVSKRLGRQQDQQQQVKQQSQQQQEQKQPQHQQVLGSDTRIISTSSTEENGEQHEVVVEEIETRRCLDSLCMPTEPTPSIVSKTEATESTPASALGRERRRQRPREQTSNYLVMPPFLTAGCVGDPRNIYQNNSYLYNYSMDDDLIRNRVHNSAKARHRRRLRHRITFDAIKHISAKKMHHIQTVKSADEAEYDISTNRRKRRTSHDSNSLLNNIFDPFLNNHNSNGEDDEDDDVLYYDSDLEDSRERTFQNSKGPRQVSAEKMNLQSDASAQYTKNSTKLRIPRKILHSSSVTNSEIRQIVSMMKSFKFTLLWHPNPTKEDPYPKPCCVHAWIERGTYLMNQNYVQPKFMWKPVVEEHIDKRQLLNCETYQKFGLLEIARIDSCCSDNDNNDSSKNNKSSSKKNNNKVINNTNRIDRTIFPFAKPSSSFVIKTKTNYYLFQAQSSTECSHIVFGLKLVVARLASLLIVRHMSAVEEFFEPSETNVGKPPACITGEV